MIANVLKYKTIVVSGGTKGVGRGVVLECSRLGAKVVIGGRDEGAAQGILEQIGGFGGEGVFVRTDLRKTDDCKQLFDIASERFGRIDGFFNYAGITTAASLLECNEDDFNTNFEVNTRAALFCCKHAVLHMKESGGGSIVLTGSPHAWGGHRDRVAYACSKGALLTLTNHIAQHYAEFGIRANYITMGWTPTEGEIAFRREQGMSQEELRALASDIVPAGRMTEVGDIVPGIIYLLSDDSKMVSGANLRITGGLFI
jgi:NAD(P)-dependent dehydrogenase (short-subunit alcohol dehydrogenase family)